MKIKDIATKYNIDAKIFEKFIKKYDYPYTESFLGDMIIADEDVNDFVQKYHIALTAAKERADEKAKVEQVENETKRKAMSEMLITSGFSFDGYRITKYSGYISGDDAISVDRGLAVFGSGVNVKDKLMESLVKIRRNALKELKEAAYALGCNAVIGVDFDYLTLDPQTANLGGGTTYQPYVFGVTANGNAVIIEKIENDD